MGEERLCPLLTLESSKHSRSEKSLFWGLGGHPSLLSSTPVLKCLTLVNARGDHPKFVEKTNKMLWIITRSGAQLLLYLLYLLSLVRRTQPGQCD